MVALGARGMALVLCRSWAGGMDIVLALVCAFVRFDGGRVVILSRPTVGAEKSLSLLRYNLSSNAVNYVTDHARKLQEEVSSNWF